MRLVVYGASDDLIEVEGDVLSDEFGNYTGSKDTNGRLIVSVNNIPILEIVPVYRGFWAFAIGPTHINDYEEMPDWKIVREWGTKIRYSETVTIDLPDGATAEFVRPKE